MESAELLLSESISSDEIKRFEYKYQKQSESGHVNNETKFQYAWCLIRSKYPSDVKKGIFLLESLCDTEKANEKRDYLFYLAIGNAKLKEFGKALKYVKQLLGEEPNNQQALNLESIIKKKLYKEGFLGMAVVGGAAVALGALIGLAFSVSKR